MANNRYKALVFTVVVLLSVIISGIYGVISSEISYSMSPEYYTRYKFHELVKAEPGEEIIYKEPHVLVGLVGIKDMLIPGILMGIAFAVTALRLPDNKTMLTATLRAVLLSLVIVFVLSVFAVGYSTIYLNGHVNWKFPKGLVDRKNFVSAGMMQRLTYFGIILGILAGISNIVLLNVKLKKQAGIEEDTVE